MTRAAGRTPAAASKATQAKQMTEMALDELADQLQEGNSTRLDDYLRAMSRFHRYSFGNIMLIVSQRPDASHVAGFRTWKSLGRSVKKGEKGIVIVAPMIIRAAEGDAERSAHDEGRPCVRFRAVHVFDVAQTEGEPLPEPARVGGDPGEALERLEAAIVASGIALETVASLDGALGVSMGGRIQIAEGLSGPERFSTLVHEWGHELLHRVPAEHRPSMTVRETEAEAVAFVVGHAIGLELSTASADYIRLYRGDAETLAASLDRIQKAACVVIDLLNDTHDRRPSASTHAPSAAVRDARLR